MVNTASTITFEALFSAYDSQPMELTEDLYLLGYINSSDKSGNIFGSIFLQDSEEEPAYGLEIKTDLLETHARFPIGAQVRVSLKGLWLGKQGAGFVLGSQKDLFGVSLIDRLPALATLNHLEVTCWEIRNLAPRISKLDSLNPNWVHTLVQIQNLELSAAYTDSIFAQKHQETRLPLQTCNGKTISLLNSGFSDFQSNFFPQGSGSVTGILLGSPGSYELVLRSESDLEFDLPSCAVRFPPVTSDQLFISELADPDNEPQARFIEIFNSGETTLDLKGWTLLRYTNANTVPGAPAELTGLMLSPGAAAVISAWPEVFSETYGFEPDLIIRINGPADSNGDDNIVLLDPFGTTIDVFGIPGEDGTGTGHEYEDGAAVRSSFVRRANTIFTPAEWIIRNDSGGNGTENRPCYAPEDFTPGRHDLY
ncbi:MAG: hypothetical protein RLZZ241_1555 [Bacteroidota bacterium]